MDPALQEVLREGAVDDAVPAIIRLEPGQAPPPHFRVVARFGDIATVRVRRGDVGEAYASNAIASFKAIQWLMPEADMGDALIDEIEQAPAARDTDARRQPEWPTGRGTVVAALDWGLDFTHPDFRHENGRTRLRALWDQGARYDPRHPNRYGYGRVFDQASIDAALLDTDPFRALGYDPRRADRGSGTHGTHVLSIAAGNGRGGGPEGFAPEAELLFVHMGASAGHGGAQSLTDSAAVLEGLDFVHRIAGDAPACINLSMGTHGGPHDGSTLVERGIDAFLLSLSGRYVVQSTGNYFSRRVHSAGRLTSGERARLPLIIDPDDTTPNDVELWYHGSDAFHITVEGPDQREYASAELGQTAIVMDQGQEIGRLYHRRNDPNNRDHQVMLRLDAPAAVGRWTVVIDARHVIDGRWNAWIERDSRCAPCQSVFPGTHAVRSTTTGSICNGQESIVVGAYDARQPQRPLGRFSSAGPTRDGRNKPDLLAPGVQVLAARSRPLNAQRESALLTRMSGTSMAAPHVTGSVALLCEILGAKSGHREMRELLRQSCRRHEGADPLAPQRSGAGHLDTPTALRLAQQSLLPSPSSPIADREPTMTTPTPPPIPTESLDDADEARRRRRAPLPLITPVIGPGGIGAAVVAPFGGTAIIAPLTPMSAPAPAAAPCACTPSATPSADVGGAVGVAVASSEPTVAATPELEAQSETEADERTEHRSHWTTAPADLRDAADSALAEQAFVDTAADAEFEALTESDEGDVDLAPIAWTLSHDELAEESIRDAPEQSVGELVRDLLGRAGWHGESAHFDESAFTGNAVAARLFDHFVGRRHVLPPSVADRFDVVALPGAAAGMLRSGDWLLRRGEGGIAHVSVIATPRLWPSAALLAQGWQTENRRSGGFVHVIDLAYGGRLRDDRFARRVCDAAQRVLPDTLLLRPRPVAGFGEYGEADESVEPRWLQQALNRVLGLALAVDGDIGPRTRAAIRQFQAQQGLAADGVVGPLTERALRQALAAADGGATGGSSQAFAPRLGGITASAGACTTLDAFAQGRADLTPAHHALLITLARRIQREGLRELDITGYASSEGDGASNLVLGQRRADAVARGLRETLERMRSGSSSGVVMRTESRGESEQIAGGSREQNRRVDVCLRARQRPPTPRPPQPAPPPRPQRPAVETKVFRVTGKSFIAVVGSRTGTLDCGVDVGPVRIPGGSNIGLRALALATDQAFSEDPRHDRVFTAAPPQNKGYRLFSQGRVEAQVRDGQLIDVSLPAGLITDAGKECGRVDGMCLQAPPLIIDQAFSTRRISATAVQFRWGVKGRPPPVSEVVFSGICVRTSVYIWHEIVGTVEVVNGQAAITRLFIQGSRFPSHRAWVDGAQAHHVPQGPMSNLWDAAPGDPTRVR